MCCLLTLFLYSVETAYQRHLRPRRLGQLIEVLQRVAPESARVGGGGWFRAVHPTADGGEGRSAVMTALAERWWDTTNTFHFRFGEMTVTPLDFAAITELRVGGEPIPFNPSIDLDDTALGWFLGRVPRHSGGVAEYGQFTTYWDHEPADDVEAAQMARAYLLYLFGASRFRQRSRFTSATWRSG
ncbi:hypothetical protein RHMOL_Rhmol01G0168100 [Rhododendron molle]|uniref:Uncharacterized protein n=1 Tax=Rhododendron molle TaxID=49168 RepID=A0ACC0Q456_RHOML|nr:hypothetical protein RHMOL_Rhmol01G0168100 [Rhododendron molle]